MSEPTITLFRQRIVAREHLVASYREYQARLSDYDGVIHHWYGMSVLPFEKGRFHWHLIWEPNSRRYDQRADGWVETVEEAVAGIEDAAAKDFLAQFERRYRRTLSHVREMQEFLWAKDSQRPTVWDLLQ